MPLREISRAPGPGACLYCRRPLGQNDVLSGLPTGRRFAFDGARRRLWIVCLSCRRWCSCVAYALDEILEECERHHRDATGGRCSERERFARHASGVEWIRLNDVGPGELALWRYGTPSPSPRWRRARALVGERGEAWLLEREDRLRVALTAAPCLVGGLAVGTLSEAALAQASALGLVMLAFFQLFTADSEAHGKRLERLGARAQVALGRFTDVGGDALVLHGDQAWRSRIVSGPEAGRWRLRVPARQREGAPARAAHELEGGDALRALRLSLAETGRGRAHTAAIRSATAAIESAGGAAAFLSAAPAEAARRGLRYATLGDLPRALRLPLEIAADEAYERIACEGDVTGLEPAAPLAD